MAMRACAGWPTDCAAIAGATQLLALGASPFAQPPEVATRLLPLGGPPSATPAARNPACGGDSRSCSPQSAHRRARLSRVLLWLEPSLGQESRASVGSTLRANLGAS